MKITIFLFLTGGLFLIAESSYSQQLLPPINMKNVTLSQIFSKIEQESNFVFLFTDDANEELSKKITIETDWQNIAEIVEQVLKNTNLTYVVRDRQIAVYKKENKPELKKKAPVDLSVAEQNQQLITIEGIVTDDDSEPLPGVTIVLKTEQKEKLVKTTDVNGKYTFTNLKVGDVLIFSYIGMKRQEVTIEEGQTTYNVVLKYTDRQLKEVVVQTGMYNKARESYTGAATSISSKELNMASNRSVLSSIRNIDPSFNIMENLNLGSDPNSLPSITVRGGTSINLDINDVQSSSQSLSNANMPLFIIDGFETTLQKVMDLDENRIENITLLKDASATSLYGSRGANGVVVITTQKPAPGKLQATYKFSLNFEAPDLSSYNLLNAREKLEYERLAGLYTASAANTSQQLVLDALYNQRKKDTERGVDTYWIKYPVHLGVGHRHNLRLEGGENAVRYAATASYNKVSGAMKGSERNTFNGSVFLSYSVDNFVFQNDLQIGHSVGRNSPYGSFSTYGKLNSYWKPYDDEGNLLKKLEDNQSYYSNNVNVLNNTVYNPLWDTSLPSKDETKYTDITNNFAVEWHLIPKELFFRGTFSIYTKSNRDDIYKSANHTDFDQWVGDDYARRGTYKYTSGNSSSYEVNTTANYTKLFAEKHQLYAGLGFEVSEIKSENYNILAEGITVLNMDFLGMASSYEENGRPTGTESTVRRVGFSSTANYTYDRKYFADSSFKLEGSSQFGSNKRTAPFWSAGAGWNIHNESFMKRNSVFDIARLRLSYGTSGSLAFLPYQALTMYESSGGQSYNGWYGLTMMALGNPDLTWQKTGQLNIGTELQMFDNRIRLNLDVYNKTTNSLLTDVSTPSSAGFTSYKANVGKVENKGIEANINVQVIRNAANRLFWSVGATLAHNKNTIKKISNSLEILNEKLLQESSLNPSLLYKEGESLYTIYAVKSKGIDPSNGQEIFIKADGTETYTWNPKDKVACGQTEPKVFGNLNTTLRFKDFTFIAFWGYTIDRTIYNSTLANKVENIKPNNNADRRVLYNRWQKPGDIAFFKAINDMTPTYATSRLIMNENSFTCQSMTLRYDVPATWSKKYLRSSYISLQATVEDIFYISTIERERGLDYPYSNKFSFSTTIRF